MSIEAERYGANGVATRPATPPLASLATPRSVGDEALAGELRARFRERQIRRGDDHVGLLEHVVGDGRAVTADEIEQGLERRCEALLVPRLDGGHDLVVEVVELVHVLVGELVLPLGRDAHDHAGRSGDGAGAPASSPLPSACGVGVPWPSSARNRARSSSTAEAEDSSCSCRSMSSWPAVRLSWSSNAPAASSSSIALARARMFSVLSIARCIAMPTSAIS